jgi:cytochrome c biogenesis protein CcmG/thiol:disulfide interchange protein DsbE
MRYAVYSIPVIFMLVVGAFFYRGLFLSPDFIESPLIGRGAPEYALPELRDPMQLVGSDSFKGQIALVNVWATWCVGCRQEHGFLVELKRAGIVPIYGVNWRDERELALDWLDRLGNPYESSAFDADGSVAIDWGVYGAPETFLIDRDGTVLYKHIAPLNSAVWQTEFMPRILEKCGTLPCPQPGRG